MLMYSLGGDVKAVEELCWCGNLVASCRRPVILLMPLISFRHIVYIRYVYADFDLHHSHFAQQSVTRANKCELCCSGSSIPDELRTFFDG
jgi:hypothetical protein